MISFSVVITTYNRPAKVSSLINQLLPLSGQSQMRQVIVIDSSEIILSPTSFGSPPTLSIIKSSHKNQPYQRFLGATISQSAYILFLDDDMEVTDTSFAHDIGSLINRGYAGVNFKFRNDNMFFRDMQSSVFLNKKWAIKFRTWSGHPDIKDGKIWFCGIVGLRTDNSSIEYVSGGAFLAKKDILFKGVSTTLFDLFESKLGGGEDRIIGLALSLHGTVWAHPKTYFYHNDQGDSVYTVNHYQYSKRVAYSRLFLSCEYAKLKQQSILFAFIHYQWYSLWRLAGLVANCVYKPSLLKFAQIKGYLAGVFMATFKLAPRYFLNEENNNSNYWNRAVSYDIQAASLGTVS